MAKYYVKLQCGCEDVMQLTGPVKNREWRIAQRAKEMCFNCQKKFDLQRARERAIELGLAELRGTGAQIDWAMVIRDYHIRAAENITLADIVNILRFNCNLDFDKNDVELLSTLKTDIVDRIKYSSWLDSSEWIDMRKGTDIINFYVTVLIPYWMDRYKIFKKSA